MEWISVEQRLPEQGRKVLVYVKHPVMGVNAGKHEWKEFNYISIGLKCCQDHNRWMIVDREDFHWPDQVLFWKELPEAPEGY